VVIHFQKGGQKKKKKKLTFLNGRVVVNAGLWFGDPDVDALTRLFYPIEVKKKVIYFTTKWHLQLQILIHLIFRTPL
jgi:hypothetical protein